MRVFGMSPIAHSTASGAEWKAGLAWALIGGFISSLLLTLVRIPVIYVKVSAWRETVPEALRKLRESVRRRLVRRPATEEPAAAMDLAEGKAQ
jgi:hypothetical protein